ACASCSGTGVPWAGSWNWGRAARFCVISRSAAELATLRASAGPEITIVVGFAERLQFVIDLQQQVADVLPTERRHQLHPDFVQAVQAVEVLLEQLVQPEGR